MNVIDLFSGVGGLSYGFESAGFNILLGIDNDAKALETFELNHKDSKSICGDITEKAMKYSRCTFSESSVEEHRSGIDDRRTIS